MAKSASKKSANTPTATSGSGKPKTASDLVRRDRLEWIAAGISAAVVVALVGYIAFEAITRSGGVPNISVSIDEIYQMEAGYGVDVTVFNASSATVADVEFQAISHSEISSFTLDYLPAGSQTRAGVGFTQAPEAGSISVRVIGFTYP